MSNWTDKLKKNKKILAELKRNRCLFLIEFMEFLEDNGFGIIGFNPGVAFYVKDKVRNNTYKHHIDFNRRQAKAVWRLIKLARKKD